MVIQFADYGDLEEVDVERIKSLPHVDLIDLPPQVGDSAVKYCFCLFCVNICFMCLTFLAVSRVYDSVIISGFPCLLKILESPSFIFVKFLALGKSWKIGLVLESPGIQLWFKLTNVHRNKFGLLLTDTKWQ